MKKNDSKFYIVLRDYIIKNINASNLARNDLFLKTHFNVPQNSDKPTKYTLHRCRQWVSDLRSDNRTQSLTIEDLETICALTNLSAGVILQDNVGQTEEVEYLDESFIRLLAHMQLNGKYSELFESLFLPVRYDPTAHVMLAIAGTSSAKRTPLAAHAKGEDVSKIRFIVYSLHSISKSGPNGQPDRFEKYHCETTNYKKAVNDFTYYSKSEKGSVSNESLAARITHLLRKIKSDFYKKENDVGNIVEYQKLFYTFFPSILSNLGIKKQHFRIPLDLQINIKGLDTIH